MFLLLVILYSASYLNSNDILYRQSIQDVMPETIASELFSNITYHKRR